jgi:hypothetical protein
MENMKVNQNSRLDYSNILISFQTLLFVLYMITMPVSYSRSSSDHTTTILYILARVRPSEFILVAFIGITILRNGLKWKYPFTFIAFLAYFVALSSATLIARYCGYAMVIPQYSSWIISTCAFFVNLIAFLAMYNYLISISWSAKILLLRFFVTTMTIFGLIGIYDLFASVYHFPRLSHYFVTLLYFNRSVDVTDIHIDYIYRFIGTADNPGWAGSFYYYVAAFTMINITLISKKQKLLFSLFLWVPFTAILLTLRRTESLSVIVALFTIVCVAFIMKIHFRERLVQVIWIGMMTALISIVLIQISPTTKIVASIKTVGYTVPKETTVSSAQPKTDHLQTNHQKTFTSTATHSGFVSPFTHSGFVSPFTQNGYLYLESRNALNDFIQHPLGYGFVGYKFVHKGQHMRTHNFYIHLLVEGGIFGVIAGIFVFVMLFWEPVRNRKFSPIMVTITNIYVPFMIGLCFVAFHMPLTQLRIFWFFIAFVLALTTIDTTQQKEQQCSGIPSPQPNDL